ncbi:hypothetical protein FACS1894109_13520 [Spirochaetia bacterium]|nr:hypothetical protein FACS1894109_13520 [Spirochaetia bacterium]
MIYVLDASAVIAIFREEAGKEKVWDILREAEKGTVTVYISKVNLIEVSYKFYRDLGKEANDALLEHIYRMPIQVQSTIAENVFSEASRLKGTYTMSLGDAIGLGTAINLNGVFVTSDGELTEPEAVEHAPVFWFRPPKEKHDKKKLDVNAVIRRAEEAEKRATKLERRIAELEAKH